MKRLRHRLGRWLLRDAPYTSVTVRVDPSVVKAYAARMRGLDGA